MNIFVGMMKLWIFLGVITKQNYFFWGGGHLYTFLGFFKVKVQNHNIFGGLLI